MIQGINRMNHIYVDKRQSLLLETQLVVTVTKNNKEA